MKNQMDTAVRSIGMEQWCDLAKTGAAPSVTTRLCGDSMRPLIRREKDEVTIQPLYRNLKRGDIVLFRSGYGRYVVHRVWKLQEQRVQTVGDNCWEPDPWMPYEHVLGLAVCMKRNGRSIRLNNAIVRGIGRAWMRLRPLRNMLRSSKSRVGRMIRKVGAQRR